ncbi:MAG: hypothetical protein IKM81_04980 [Fibrobacter sp.]|nr:hypothetical protein [Fibrobacter sp.]
MSRRNHLKKERPEKAFFCYFRNREDLADFVDPELRRASHGVFVLVRLFAF